MHPGQFGVRGGLIGAVRKCGEYRQRPLHVAQCRVPVGPGPLDLAQQGPGTSGIKLGSERGQPVGAGRQLDRPTGHVEVVAAGEEARLPAPHQRPELGDFVVGRECGVLRPERDGAIEQAKCDVEGVHLCGPFGGGDQRGAGGAQERLRIERERGGEFECGHPVVCDGVHGVGRAVGPVRAQPLGGPLVPDHPYRPWLAPVREVAHDGVVEGQPGLAGQ